MRFLAVFAVLPVVLFSIAGALFYSAWSSGPLPEAGCWTVTDLSGHVSVFQTAPKFDITTRAISFEKDGHAGWIFPARVDEDLVCAGTP